MMLGRKEEGGGTGEEKKEKEGDGIHTNVLRCSQPAHATPSAKRLLFDCVDFSGVEYIHSLKSSNIGTPVAVQEEVEYGRASLNNL